MTDYKAVATALNAHLSEKYNTTIVTDGAWWVEVGKLLVDAVTVAVPWLRSIIDVLDDAHSTRSVTLPKPGGEGAIIVYSSAALADGLSYCVTAVHEHEHARVLKAHPDIEVIADYMSPELRAASEARAYACGAFARYLLTGNLQTADEMVSPLSPGYLLTRAAMDWFWNHYAGHVQAPWPQDLAPLRAESHANLPPALVVTAGYDPLRDEGEAYAARLHAAGVPTALRQYPGQIHGFVSVGQDAADCIAATGVELRRVFGTSS